MHVGLQTTYTLTGFEHGATYTFAVTAYDAEGNESDYSNIVTITMSAGPTLVSPAATPWSVRSLSFLRCATKKPPADLPQGKHERVCVCFSMRCNSVV